MSNKSFTLKFLAKQFSEDADQVDAQFADPVDAQFADPVDAQFADPVDAQFADPVDAQFADPVDAQFADPVDAQFSATVDRCVEALRAGAREVARAREAALKVAMAREAALKVAPEAAWAPVDVMPRSSSILCTNMDAFRWHNPHNRPLMLETDPVQVPEVVTDPLLVAEVVAALPKRLSLEDYQRLKQSGAVDSQTLKSLYPYMDKEGYFLTKSYMDDSDEKSRY